MTEAIPKDWIQKGLEELDGCQEELVNLITQVVQVPAPATTKRAGSHRA